MKSKSFIRLDISIYLAISALTLLGIFSLILSLVF